MSEPPINQLPLLEVDVPSPEWRLDEHTREIGRAGVRQARAALRAALRSQQRRDADEPRHRAA